MNAKFFQFFGDEINACHITLARANPQQKAIFLHTINENKPLLRYDYTTVDDMEVAYKILQERLKEFE